MSNIMFNFTINGNKINLKCNSGLVSLFELNAGYDLNRTKDNFTIEPFVLRESISDIKYVKEHVPKLMQLIPFLKNVESSIKLEIDDDEQEGIIKFKQYNKEISDIEDCYALITLFEDIFSIRFPLEYSCEINVDIITKVVANIKELYSMIPQLSEIYNQCEEMEDIDVTISQE